MNRLNKYLALFMLERKDELEQMLCIINDLKRDLKDDYPWTQSLLLEEIIDEFYSNYSKDINVVDTLLHYIHIEDPSLRDRVLLLVAYYFKKYVKFHTGLMENSNDNGQIETVQKILLQNNIRFDSMSVSKTHEFHLYEGNLESIYISFLKIDEVIDRKKIEHLLTIFPNGWAE